jgi:hypothetical protein
VLIVNGSQQPIYQISYRPFFLLKTALCRRKENGNNAWRIPSIDSHLAAILPCAAPLQSKKAFPTPRSTKNTSRITEIPRLFLAISLSSARRSRSVTPTRTVHFVPSIRTLTSRSSSPSSSFARRFLARRLGKLISPRIGPRETVTSSSSSRCLSGRGCAETRFRVVVRRARRMRGG